MTKIAKGGSRGKEKTKFSSIASAYPNPVSYKDNIRQSQRKRQKQHFSSLSLAEPTTLLSDDGTRQAQRHLSPSSLPNPRQEKTQARPFTGTFAQATENRLFSSHKRERKRSQNRSIGKKKHTKRYFFLKKLGRFKKSIYICTRKSDGAIAQLVEQRTENPCVPGSIPGGTTKKRPEEIRVFFLYLRVSLSGSNR